MPVPTAISSLSQTAASNSPPGTESPTSADDYLRQYSAFIAMLRDGVGFTDPVQLASAATTSIGAQNSLFVEITGTTTITSFGTSYEGPRFLRFTGALTLTHNATALNLPGAANITTAAGDSCLAIPNQGGNGWNVVQFQRAAQAPTGYQLNSFQTFTASGTWTKPSGCRAVLVEVQAPGGGGGGVVASAANLAVGSGGGGGGYGRKWITNPSASETVTIGAVGTAGDNTGASGGTGGNTSFGAIVTCTGGAGGGFQTGGTTVTRAGTPGAGGSSTGGDINLNGGGGHFGVRFSGTVGFSGAGGNSHLGGGAAGVGEGAGGVAGGNHGGGGSGGNSDSATGRTGGAGGPGIVIVWEFY